MNKDLHTAWRWRVKSWCFGAFTTEGDLVGFILCDVGPYGYNSMYINFIAVHPEYQGYCIGTMLLKHILKKAVKASVSISLTPVKTDHIMNWYKKHGFYVTYIGKAIGGGEYILMNCHSYHTRSKPITQ
jgi:ribosomal protein S18 acetylase RimI-like enzyme